MATLRPGRKTVLMIVDVQVGVVQDAWQRDAVVQRIAALVQRARACGTPVIWVQHGDAELPTGSPAWQWVPELQPAPGETLIHKQHNSAFEDTPLDDALARLQATHIVLAGAMSNWCIRASAHGALDRGYDLTPVQDAHTTSDQTLEDGLLLPAAAVVQELNRAMTWLSYPGRRNATTPAAELRFDNDVPA